MQYPIVEALNGILYVLIFYVTDFTVDSFIFCLMTSALLVLAVIDFRTYEIPWGINLLLTICKHVILIAEMQNFL